MGGNYEKNMYNQLCELMEKVNSLESAHKEDRKEIHRLNCQVESLTKENQQLRATVKAQNKELSDLHLTCEKLQKENKILRKDNERMKRILSNNSSNSSKPPSSDGPEKLKAPNTYNSRTKSKSSVGAQKGHQGKTISGKDVKELILNKKVKHEVVKDIGDINQPYVSRYQLDLDVVVVVKEIRIHADKNGKYIIPEEYRAEVAYGSCVKSMVSTLYSECVVSTDHITDFINSISGQVLSISTGTVYNICKYFSKLCEKQLSSIKDRLLNSDVICTDATYVSMDGKQTYIRNFSTPTAVLYAYQESKKIETLKELPILPDYIGILIHDHETALYHFGTGHGECNVHLLRYLKKNTQESNNKWSRCLSGLLSCLNRFRNKCISLGKEAFSCEQILRYSKRYKEIIEYGWFQNKTTKNRIAKKEEATLLRRLDKYIENHLLFLSDFRVYFDDNMSERDLRKCKNRQKMSGGFRTEAGIKMYCNILSVVETIKRRNKGIFNGIKDMFEGRPVFI